jgi:hypothetical protein
VRSVAERTEPPVPCHGAAGLHVDHLTLYYAGALVPDSGYTVAQYNGATLTAPSFNSGMVNVGPSRALPGFAEEYVKSTMTSRPRTKAQLPDTNEQWLWVSKAHRRGPQE